MAPGIKIVGGIALIAISIIASAVDRLHQDDQDNGPDYVDSGEILYQQLTIREILTIIGLSLLLVGGSEILASRIP